MPSVTTRPRKKPAPAAAPLTHAERANQYAGDVVAGKVLACRYVRLACERQLRDLERSTKARSRFAYVFDERRANRVCRFIEKLPHTKGPWAARGETIKLQDWQCFYLCCTWGWVDRKTGKRRFRESYRELPRKQGKSAVTAAEGLFGMVGDSPGEALEVYCGATKQAQAFEVFRPAWQMVQKTSELREAFGLELAGTLKNPGPIFSMKDGSRFEALVGQPGDGASPHVYIADELHEHRDDNQLDTMRTGMGARAVEGSPLLIAITTAGVDTEGPCYAMRSRVVAMLEETVPNEQLFGVIYTVDEDVEWTSEKALRMANPNYGVSVDAKFLKDAQATAKRNSRLQNSFKRKHLDIWTGARSAWMNMEWWHRQARPRLRLADFGSEPCWLGIDLSSKIDMTCKIRLFRRIGESGLEYFAVGHAFYLPSDQVDDPEKPHYAGWAADGWLTVIDGAMIDQDFVERDVLEDQTRDDLEVWFDPTGAAQLSVRLTNAGIRCVECPPRTQYLSEPMKTVEALVKDGKLFHDGNPILTWCIANVVARVNAADEVFPRKERPENKIDGAVGLYMAAAGATRGSVVVEQTVSAEAFGWLG